MILTEKLLVLSASFARDYAARLDHFSNPVNAGKIDDFVNDFFESKLSATKEIYSFDGKDAHIRVEGPMSPNGPDLYDIFYGFGGVAYSDILDGIAQAKDDVNPKEGKLYFHTNTPGGTVSMVDDVYQEIANCGLTTVMLNKGLVASGGMWIGAACTEIVATTPVAFTGSIGVIISGYDISAMLEKMGVKRFVITNHEATDKAPDVSTAEGRKVIQQELDDIYSIFKQRVVAGRKGKISAAAIDDLKGSVKVASDALSLGLIDALRDQSAKGKTSNNHRAQATPPQPASEGKGAAMNLEQLKAEHPDLVAAIVAEAKQGMITKEQHDTALATARSEGASAEQARIADVRAQLIPGHEPLIEQLAADGKTTGPEAAQAIVAAEKKARNQAGSDLDQGANKPVTVTGDDQGAKTMKREAFNDLDQQARRAFLKGGGKVVA